MDLVDNYGNLYLQLTDTETESVKFKSRMLKSG